MFLITRDIPHWRLMSWALFVSLVASITRVGHVDDPTRCIPSKSVVKAGLPLVDLHPTLPRYYHHISNARQDAPTNRHCASSTSVLHKSLSSTGRRLAHRLSELERIIGALA
ncbi:hypothetical protein V8F06_003108 [Rhypophila decipiens]